MSIASNTIKSNLCPQSAVDRLVRDERKTQARKICSMYHIGICIIRHCLNWVHQHHLQSQVIIITGKAIMLYSQIYIYIMMRGDPTFLLLLHWIKWREKFGAAPRLIWNATVTTTAKSTSISNIHSSMDQKNKNRNNNHDKMRYATNPYPIGFNLSQYCRFITTYFLILKLTVHAISN